MMANFNMDLSIFTTDFRDWDLATNGGGAFDLLNTSLPNTEEFL